MKSISKSFLLVAALALTAVSRAATFDFAYTFGDGTLVTGRFDGVQNAGDLAIAYSFPLTADFPIDASEGLNAQSWTMTANAPDGVPTAGLLALAGLGLVGLRRRFLS
ncbi:MAG: hypothetical protein NTV51_29265 [Verrucomicrobia bacterium]|nr:hypothetical protein [Verrucomicrobiota bacterium]